MAAIWATENYAPSAKHQAVATLASSSYSNGAGAAKP
jgi:hypothetical protein